MTHQEHLLNVTKAARDRKVFEGWFRESILGAHRDGVSVVKLAEAAGVSRPTIYATIKRGVS